MPPLCTHQRAAFYLSPSLPSRPLPHDSPHAVSCFLLTLHKLRHATFAAPSPNPPLIITHTASHLQPTGHRAATAPQTLKVLPRVALVHSGRCRRGSGTQKVVCYLNFQNHFSFWRYKGSGEHENITLYTFPAAACWTGRRAAAASGADVISGNIATQTSLGRGPHHAASTSTSRRPTITSRPDPLPSQRDARAAPACSKTHNLV